jgi:Bacterial Ig-like domain
MNRFEMAARPMQWLAAVLVAAVTAGCGGGGGTQEASSGDPAKALPPTVSGTAHANGATGVPINARFGATFSEAMDPASMSNATFLVTQGTAAIPGAVSYTGVSALFIPQALLAPNTRYTATIKGGAGGARDLAGTPMANDFSWSWTTGASADTLPPRVSSTLNGNGATDVAINARVGATFSEAMDPLTLNAATFFLMQGANAVPGAVTYTGVNAVLVPAGNLAPGTVYTATVRGGAGGAKDLAGNPMAVDYTWSWTTSAAADTIAPRVTGTVNADGATNVAVNTRIGATFSEPMDPLSVTVKTFFLTQGTTAVPGTVSYSGVTAVFIPLENLLPNATYAVTIKGGALGAKDLAGNAMASDHVLSWTTGSAPDTGSPTVVSTTVPNGATNVGIYQTIGATFSEAMDPLSITNVSCTLTALVGGTEVPRWTVSYSGGAVEFHPDGYDFGPVPPNQLISGTVYTVTIKGGSGGVLDLAGNPMAGDYTWSFTTSPGTP